MKNKQLKIIIQSTNTIALVYQHPNCSYLLAEAKMLFSMPDG